MEGYLFVDGDSVEPRLDITSEGLLWVLGALYLDEDVVVVEFTSYRGFKLHSGLLVDERSGGALKKDISAAVVALGDIERLGIATDVGSHGNGYEDAGGGSELDSRSLRTTDPLLFVQEGVGIDEGKLGGPDVRAVWVELPVSNGAVTGDDHGRRRDVAREEAVIVQGVIVVGVDRKRHFRNRFGFLGADCGC